MLGALDLFGDDSGHNSLELMALKLNSLELAAPVSVEPQFEGKKLLEVILEYRDELKASGRIGVLPSYFKPYPIMKGSAMTFTTCEKGEVVTILSFHHVKRLITQLAVAFYQRRAWVYLNRKLVASVAAGEEIGPEAFRSLKHRLDYEVIPQCEASQAIDDMAQRFNQELERFLFRNLKHRLDYEVIPRCEASQAINDMTQRINQEFEWFLTP